MSVDRLDYELWLLLLSPLTIADIEETSSQQGWSAPHESLARLQALDLLVGVSGGGELEGDMTRLRPISLGVGIGNSHDSPSLFRLQDSTLSFATPVILDGLAILLWWEFDGATYLERAIANVASRFDNIPPQAVARGAAQLVCQLMAHRLLYLDVSPDLGSA